jgi:DNA ligase (NAD+)
LIDEGYIKEVAYNYGLTKPKLLKLERVKDKTATNLLAAINDSRNRPFPRVLYALGIQQVGQVTAEKLAETFRTMDALMNAGEDQLAEVRDVGPVTARIVRAFFDEPQNRALIERLKAVGLQMAYESAAGPLVGKTFVLTGSLSSLTRGQAQEKVRAAGGSVADAISRKVDYLVVGEDPGSKFEKAKKLGIKVLDETQFLALLAQQPRTPLR